MPDFMRENYSHLDPTIVFEEARREEVCPFEVQLELGERTGRELRRHSLDRIAVPDEMEGRAVGRRHCHWPVADRLCAHLGIEGVDATIDIDGNRIKVGVNPDVLHTMQQMIPLGRPGTPAEAAGAVYLFCIPESDYVSAQTLVCSGGFTF